MLNKLMYVWWSDEAAKQKSMNLFDRTTPRKPMYRLEDGTEVAATHVTSTEDHNTHLADIKLLGKGVFSRLGSEW